MNSPIPYTSENQETLDTFTKDLLNNLFTPLEQPGTVSEETQQEIKSLYQRACSENLTFRIIELFDKLSSLRNENIAGPDDFNISKKNLIELATKHQTIDEHMVSVGGRLTQALPIASEANSRITEYLQKKDIEAPSGIELWEQVETNIAKIKKVLKMTDQDWNSFSGQLRNAIDSVSTLAEIIDLPEETLKTIARVTQSYRMRLTPYYATLIMPVKINDPVMLQSVPTGEMIENAGIEIPPVAADHSPARLIDQFYPRVLSIKATNMCAMYCTHCLRLAHIGRKDEVYSKEAYGEAIDYIRKNEQVRDVLITGGDAFLLPNSILKWILGEICSIDHVKAVRLGTRIPVTSPMRIDSELLDILGETNDQIPVRVVTQINTPQEITPVSRLTFREISKNTFTVLNQAVLLKGINDTRIKMWKLCETVHEAYVRPYYLFNCSFRNPQFSHFRVPLEVGRDIIESMYGNISGDAIPRYIATAGGKIPLHRSNVVKKQGNDYILRKPWNNQEVSYPDVDPDVYMKTDFAFNK